MKKRKLVTMLVTVSVPVEVSAAEARREVRTLIGEQSNYDAEPDDIKVRSIKPAKVPA